MKLERLATRSVVSIATSSSLEQAARLMRDRHVGALLVVEDSRAVGIVTDRDLVLRAAAEGIGPREATVGEVMSRALATLPAGAGVDEALETMRRDGLRRLVLTDERGEPAGIVSLDDIIGAFVEQLAGLRGILATEIEREAAREADRGASSA